MHREPALIGTIAVGLGVAFLLGLLAVRLRMPPIVGYLLAGMAVGPFTPGPTVDAGLAGQLAELGIILLMFGVGLHFKLRDLVAVRRVVVPGAALQAAITTVLGAMIARLSGWTAGEAVVLGLSVSVASTVVMLKGLERRDRLDSPDGRLAVGWLVVEDMLMILALVLLPAIAPALGGSGASGTGLPLAGTIALAVLKVAVFVSLMILVGRRAIPWLLEQVARLGSRELFTLAVLAAALGIGSVASGLFGVSFALGAFFAGAVISESDLSARAAADALPMQDAFAVLFFVSIGMLFDPAVLTQRPAEIFAVVGLVVVWKSALTFQLVRLLGAPRRAALLLASSVGQIGEFSFIVGALGASLGLIDPGAQGVIVAASFIAIILNGPIVGAAMQLGDRASGGPDTVRTATWPAPRTPDAASVADDGPAILDPHDCSDMQDHVVLIGYGRVGSTVAGALQRAAAPYVVVEEQERIVAGLRARGERAILGDATRLEVLDRAGIGRARLLVVTAPEPIRARRIVEVARGANPALNVAVRTHSAAEQEYFEGTLGASGARGRAVYAEREAALNLAHYALLSFGRSDDQADLVVGALRDEPTRPTEMFAAVGVPASLGGTAGGAKRSDGPGDT